MTLPCLLQALHYRHQQCPAPQRRIDGRNQRTHSRNLAGILLENVSVNPAVRRRRQVHWRHEVFGRDKGDAQPAPYKVVHLPRRGAEEGAGVSMAEVVVAIRAVEREEEGGAAFCEATQGVDEPDSGCVRRNFEDDGLEAVGHVDEAFFRVHSRGRVETSDELVPWVRVELDPLCVAAAELSIDCLAKFVSY